MTDMCKSGQWDIDPAKICPICNAPPDGKCLGESANEQDNDDAAAKACLPDHH